jgi:cytochrome c
MGLCASIASSRALGTREGTCTTATTLTPAPAFHRSRTYPSSAVHRDVDAHSETALTKLGFEPVLAPRLPGRPNEPRNNTASSRHGCLSGGVGAARTSKGCCWCHLPQQVEWGECVTLGRSVLPKAGRKVRSVLPKAGRKVSRMRNRNITLACRRAAVALAAIAALLLGSVPGLADGDAAAGKQAFTTTCGACHSTEPGVNKIGPSLAGIVGSKSGTVAGYNFSPALKAANITWDEQTLDKFLENPSADVHGTKMVIKACPLVGASQYSTSR